jgi:hypothetical protein
VDKILSDSAMATDDIQILISYALWSQWGQIAVVPMDYRDWLIRQQQQERIAQRFDALFTKDEDHAAAATQRIEDQAYYDAQEAAAAYDDVQELLTDVITPDH